MKWLCLFLLAATTCVRAESITNLPAASTLNTNDFFVVVQYVNGIPQDRKFFYGNLLSQLGAIKQTNQTTYSSNLWGVFKNPYWNPATLGDRAALLDDKGTAMLVLRHSGVQPSGVNEGINDEVMYFVGKDAYSFQTQDSTPIGAGRVTFVFGSELFTWRIRETNITVDPQSLGQDYSLIGHDNSTNVFVGHSLWTNNVLGKVINLNATGGVNVASGSLGMNGPGIYSASNNTAANGSLYLDGNGKFWVRTNNSWKWISSQ